MDIDPTDRSFQLFMELQAGLDQQGPGSDALTLRALQLLPDLPRAPAVLDVGCGPGRQTLCLARALPEAEPIIAVDFFEVFLEQLDARAVEAGLARRMETRQGDMTALDLAPGSFDLIWSEGAIYIMGFAAGLAAWRPLLRPGGCVAVTEITWLVHDPPAEIQDYWADAYPDMVTVEANLQHVRDAGYRPLGHFVLPSRSWWDGYYTPLQARHAAARERYAGDAEALAVVAEGEAEIELFRRFHQTYGYVFYLMQLP